MARKATELRPVMTRIPEGMRRNLAKEAKKNRRSMNAEIIDRLAKSFVSEDLMELYRRYASLAAKDAAKETISQFVERLRSEMKRYRDNEKSLLGNVGERSILEAMAAMLSDTAPAEPTDEKDTAS
jgi:hypothetical protein